MDHAPPEADVRSETAEAGRVGQQPTAHPPRFPDTEEGTGVGHHRRGATRKRRWPSILGKIIAIAIAVGFVVLIVLLHLTGTFGPGVH